MKERFSVIGNDFSTFKRSAVILGMMLVTMVILSLVHHSEEIKPNKPFDTFPMEIGPWQGTPENFSEQIYDVLGVDDSILATYRSSTGGSIHLYVGFYQSQKEGELIHSPKNCLPGSGWNITKTAIVPINVSVNNEKLIIDAIRLWLEKGPQKQIVLYWFQSRGRIISSEYMQKIWLVIDSITKRRTDGSFVRFIAPVEGSEAETIERMKGFIREVFPYLVEYIPS